MSSFGGGGGDRDSDSNDYSQGSPKKHRISEKVEEDDPQWEDKSKVVFEPSKKLNFHIGCRTDIGGGRENQDDSFTWESPDHEGPKVVAMGMFDGHGREVGKTAAKAGVKKMLEFFNINWRELLHKSTAYECLVRAFKESHEYIKETFRSKLEEDGFIVSEDPEGYLLKRLPWHHVDSCVHGGATCSLIVFVGTLMYTVNVGDSAALLSTMFPVLKQRMLNHIGDAALPNDAPPPHRVQEGVDEADVKLVLTCEHSPESISEYMRMMAFRHREGDETQPALSFVYDSPTQDKSQCPPIFFRDVNDILAVTGKGKYVKNVRREWASIVSTPASARFQDGLAFTRSLADFHLQTYGVTYLPEVQVIDLQDVFTSLDGITIEPGQHPMSKKMFCVVLATDGLWDNWTFEDLQKFVMDTNRFNQVFQPEGGGIEEVAEQLMAENIRRARVNFGINSDNATFTIAYFSI